MTYRLTIEDETGRKIEREISADQALSLFFVQPAAVPTPEPKPHKKRKDKLDELDEAPSRKRFDPDEIRRLLKDSDLSVAEIATKIGCSYGTVYTIKAAMRRDGEL